MALYRACHWICRGRTSLSLAGAGSGGLNVLAAVGIVGGIGVDVPGKQVTAEGSYGKSDDDCDPDGEEEPIRR